MYLRYLRKQRGGRLSNVATFCSECEEKQKDATWSIETSLQSGDEASESFAHVGLAKLLSEPVIVKVMRDGRMAQQESTTHTWFRNNPHPNIIQGICEFKCTDNPIKWQRRVYKPQPMCDISSTIPFMILVQEYIRGGDLHTITDWNIEMWLSIILQLTFASMEWYEQHGFLYGDWHFGNILLDVTNESSVTYKAFGHKWKVKNTTGLRPVLTDFSRSDLRKPNQLEPWQLGAQLGVIWDMLSHKCPNTTIQETTSKASIDIGTPEDINEILTIVRAWKANIENK